ncbi:hypothetical protein CcaverHIS002_0202740 [Cutaneotrichosporon cavernicola]|uniref:DNA-directed RNA polymerase III subunit RPC6 n=1 Tax=Cutaneotrichosporon cavernicola TaxID=279322 RepID=A0AA48L1H1_9TREE|nr:uncharacterized protein CcaverHIS019_0202740 [Cutaneotrichosporon cavernicola]BEI81114.1 hypothetical protein CcaverHIS002_0202740 [Cutaneotrichosporon cavernicola]BEI88912.1 hypothetical protein CcaverHIS019_0202740 [Cutaneotrichosporon cavernicola]BEI96689.1 hypothetical protein CcaverHIS631_0202780 [Cutaneotrichosporon cavernicola]BEJ04461.1 hypothetical protein CcaverHIS641_0202780 [Cutaneotrichosporon cavernicola]
MSATLSSVEQKVYKKVMASKKKAMTQQQIETAIPGLSKKDCHSAINKILGLKLFTASKNSKGELVFHGVAVEDARKQNTLTTEQQYVLQIVDKAGNTGISKPSIANQVNTEIMARMQVFRALESLEKVGLVKTFKSVNAPTMPLYILAHLKPPEDMAGGIWFDESKEYDSVFVDTLRGVVLNFIQLKTFPQRKAANDAISKLCSNPIYPISQTAALPTPSLILSHLQKNKVTSAPLTVKNVMEICRALELDGLIEMIKPVGGVSVDQTFDSDSDEEPVLKRSRKNKRDDDDDDMDPEERERRERKEREKMKAKLKEAKREKQRKERAREREKEKERKRREKEKERKRKEKERERKRKAKDKERARKEKDKRKKKRVVSSDLDDSDEELREVDEPKSRRKKRALSDESDLSTSSSSSSDSDSDSDSDMSVSSVDSDDLDNGTVSLKPQSSAAAINLANPFFSDTGRQTLIDLSDQAVLYRALSRLTIALGQTQAPCGTCPQFNFCEEGGPVNADSCSYFTDWLSGTGGGWTADVKAEKAKKAAEEEQARRRAAAAANGETYVEEPLANGDEVYEEDGEYDHYDAPMDEGEEGYY